MKFWIEVSTGDQAWTRKLESGKDHKRGLKAPATTKLTNILNPVQPGDIVLSHLTVMGTRTKNWRGAIVGISTTASECYKKGGLLIVDLTDNLELPKPIKFSEYRYNGSFSEIFLKAISYRLQRYLIEIAEGDFTYLIALHQENIEFLRGSVYSKFLDKY